MPTPDPAPFSDNPYQVRQRFLEEVNSMDTTELNRMESEKIFRLIRFGLSDPGSFLPRRSEEPVPAWAARAVVEALRHEHLSIRPDDELVRMVEQVQFLLTTMNEATDIDRVHAASMAVLPAMEVMIDRLRMTVDEYRAGRMDST